MILLVIDNMSALNCNGGNGQVVNITRGGLIDEGRRSWIILNYDFVGRVT